MILSACTICALPYEARSVTSKACETDCRRELRRVSQASYRISHREQIRMKDRKYWASGGRREARNRLAAVRMFCQLNELMQSDGARRIMAENPGLSLT